MASTPTPQPIPDGYRRVTPALVVDGATKALEFYAEVFGATERMRVPGPGGTIAHAEIEIGDSVVMVEDASPFMGTMAPPAGGLEGSPIALFIYVEDVDATMERAEQLGATIERPASNQFYGDRDGRVVDPFGHRLDRRHPCRGRRARRDDPADERVDGRGLIVSRSLLDPYRRAQNGFDTVLRAVPADNWDAPSACAEWTLRDVAGHVIWGQEQLAHWATGQEYGRNEGAPGTRHPGQMAGTDPGATWRAARAASDQCTTVATVVSRL